MLIKITYRRLTYCMGWLFQRNLVFLSFLPDPGGRPRKGFVGRSVGRSVCPSFPTPTSRGVWHTRCPGLVFNGLHPYYNNVSSISSPFMYGTKKETKTQQIQDGKAVIGSINNCYLNRLFKIITWIVWWKCIDDELLNVLLITWSASSQEYSSNFNLTHRCQF